MLLAVAIATLKGGINGAEREKGKKKGMRRE